MMKRVLIFSAFGFMWNIGAFGLFLLGLFRIAYLEWSAQIRPVHFWIALAVSLVGIVAIYARLKSPAEQLSWTERELRSLRHLTDRSTGVGLLCLGAGFILIVAKLATLVCMPSARIAPVPFGVFGWMILGGGLLLLPSYLIEIWRLDNLGQMLGWNKSLPRN